MDLSRVRISRLFLILAGVLASSAAFAFTPTDEGIFAVFETNHGAFAARLYHQDVPQTVANFVGLAEGSRYHLDAATGRVQATPYYDGVIFHRVIDGFMIQGGSPNGQGTDGPGYTIADEIRAGRVHAGPGFLSMAKTLMPNSGGSQFFITLAATPWLDGLHTVFGEVVSGMDVVTAIGRVPVGATDRPVDPVVMHTVRIIRNGSAAAAFEVAGHGLPSVQPVRLELNAGQVHFERDPSALYHFSGSSDLVTWSKITPFGPADSGTAWSIAEQLQGGSSYFVAAGSIRMPRFSTLTNRRLVVNLEGQGQLELNFGGETTGNDTLGGSGGTIDRYEWFDVGQTPQVFAQFSGLLPMQIYLQERDQPSGTAFVRVLRSLVPPYQPDFNLTGTYQWH